MAKGKLNARQKRFIEEYLIHLNATEAAQRAGYSMKTAYSQGSRLLKHVQVKAEIDRRRVEMARMAGCTAQGVLDRAWAIAHENGSDRTSALNVCSKYFPEFNRKTVDHNIHEQIEPDQYEALLKASRETGLPVSVTTPWEKPAQVN